MTGDVKFKITGQELNKRLRWCTGKKILHAVEQFVDYYDFARGEVYLSFSGGKDSQVLDDIIQRTFDKSWNINEIIDIDIYNELIIQSDILRALALRYNKPLWINKVFANTGLEFPEIVDHVKQFDHVIIVKPRMGFTRVISEVGVAVGSKKIAMMITRIKKHLSNPKSKAHNTYNLYMNGIKRDGSRASSSSILPSKWKKLLKAPFPVSDKCCDIFKKEPFKKYEKENNKLPMTATTVNESIQRRSSYLKTGCNSYNKGKEMSRPYSIFTDEDTWSYHDIFNLRFCSVYYNREVEVKELNGDIVIRKLEAETRTGCTFCMFGLHLEPKDNLNRIQRLRLSHPKYYDIVIDKCGLGKVLEFLDIPYKVNL